MAHVAEPPRIVADLQQYLQQSREALLRALDGLGEYDARRPLTPSGTNVLGLVKHLAGVEADYLGHCVGRPAPIARPWVDDGSIWEGADLWVTAAESRAAVTGLYRDASAHSDATLAALSLDSRAHVAWWPPERRRTTLGHLLVRVVAETAQHAGHAEILREGVDGQAGRDRDEMGDDTWWSTYRARVQEAAEPYRADGADEGARER